MRNAVTLSHQPNRVRPGLKFSIFEIRDYLADVIEHEFSESEIILGERNRRFLFFWFLVYGSWFMVSFQSGSLLHPRNNRLGFFWVFRRRNTLFLHRLFFWSTTLSTIGPGGFGLCLVLCNLFVSPGVVPFAILFNKELIQN